MNPLLEQFLSESRDALQGIGEKLLLMEKDPASNDLMVELFRLVHTLKGNSGLFGFPELTRVLHAGEDLMDAVRQGTVAYSQVLADRLLDAMDFVGILCDEIETQGTVDATHSKDSVRLADALRALIGTEKAGPETADYREQKEVPPVPADGKTDLPLPLFLLPEQTKVEASRAAAAGKALHWLIYSPVEDCFFQGDDPFYQARHTPEILWGGISARKPWPKLAELDPYTCLVDFAILSTAPLAELEEYFRYVAQQVKIIPVARQEIETSANAAAGSAPAPHLPEVTATLAAQRAILSLSDDVLWLPGRIKAAAASLSGCLRAIGCAAAIPGMEAARDAALSQATAIPLLLWFDSQFSRPAEAPLPQHHLASGGPPPAQPDPLQADQGDQAARIVAPPGPEVDVKFGRRAEDAPNATKSIKVDQAKIDRLMNLIGEIVVAKNALPYLAGRAETVFGVRELSREIKVQYAVINRIAEEMQDSIMQVRMMPVSFVFQRFPRLVRDTANKLGKEVTLVLEGEETEADKNVIESLGDPLVHIVRNSLDHGIETPEVRRGLGKPAAGTIVIKATQESDRVIIEIRDDGKGIDPDRVKQKAYEKGIIDNERMLRITDQEAVNLVFAPGFSTMDVVSDLSGRGVGMDVVRTAVEKVNGTITLESEKGLGTRICLSLPLSMAITDVMIVESNEQLFGVPMESVLETVRIARADIRTIKKSQATVLRGRIVPLKSLNSLLGLNIPPKANQEDEIAVLIVSLGGEAVGIMVDDFRETAAIILKPMTGVLMGLSEYAGSALLGDGSVLMVLNIKEMF